MTDGQLASNEQVADGNPLDSLQKEKRKPRGLGLVESAKERKVMWGLMGFHSAVTWHRASNKCRALGWSRTISRKVSDVGLTLRETYFSY